VQLVSWPKGSPLEGSFEDPSKVIGRGLIVPTLPNEPILESKLAPTEAGAGVTAAIPEGMRAVSIQVNSVIGVSGFVAPGSRVDLVLTGTPPIEGKVMPGDELASKVVLENLQVLAAGQNVQPDAQGKPQTVQVVTLLVTPEQAERIALASGDRIQLALRNPLDLKPVNPPMVRRSQLYAGELAEAPQKPKPQPKAVETAPKRAAVRPSPKPAPVIEPPPPLRVSVVELIQGSKRTTESFEEKKVEDKKPEEKKP
jgi:pilus assembly protein CpaB